MKKNEREPRRPKAGLRPSVEEIGQAIESKGGTLSCPVCGREEFALEEVTVFAAGMRQTYGRTSVRRAHLVCENCGCVVSLDLERLNNGLRDAV